MSITVEESARLRIDYSDLKGDVQKVLVELGVIEKATKEIGDFQKFKASMDAIWQGARAIAGYIGRFADLSAEGAKMLDQQRAYVATFGAAGDGLDEIIEKNSRYSLSLAEAQGLAIKLKDAGFERAAIEDISASTAALAAAHYVDQKSAMDGVVMALQGGRAEALLKLGFTKEEVKEYQTQGDIVGALLLKQVALGEAGLNQVTNAAMLGDAIGDIDEDFAKFVASNREADLLMGSLARGVSSISSSMGEAYQWAVEFAEQLLKAKDYLTFLITMGVVRGGGAAVDESRRRIADKDSGKFDTDALSASMAEDNAAKAQAEATARQQVAMHEAYAKAAGYFGTGGAVGRGGKKGGGKGGGAGGAGYFEQLVFGEEGQQAFEDALKGSVELALDEFSALGDMAPDIEGSLVSPIDAMFDSLARGADMASTKLERMWERAWEPAKQAQKDVQKLIKYLDDLGDGATQIVASGFNQFFNDLASGAMSAGEAAQAAGAMILSTLGEYFITKGTGAILEGLIALASTWGVPNPSSILYIAGGTALLGLGMGLSAAGSAAAPSTGATASGGGGGGATSFSPQAVAPAAPKAWGDEENQPWTVQVHVSGALLHDMADVGVYAQKGIDAAKAKRRISKAA